SKTGVQVVPALTVFQTPPEATAMKYLARSFGSTAKAITRPEVIAGPMERKRRPAKVGVDIGSEGRSCGPPSGRCSPPWPPGCPPPLRPWALAKKSACSDTDYTIRKTRNAFRVVISFHFKALGGLRYCARKRQMSALESFASLVSMRLKAWPPGAFS